MKFVSFLNKKSLNYRHSFGFALPTILIVSIIMLSVLVAAVSSAAAVRTAMVSQYYSQLSQTAADAGTAYANACLDSNNGIPQWSDVNPLKPNTDCSGAQLAGFTCPVASVDPRCYVTINDDVISTFYVSKPALDINNKSSNINSKGTVNLVRASNGSVWRSYTQSKNTETSYASPILDGLMVHLDAGNNLSYSGSGSAWTDLSGNNNNVSLMNGVGYTSAEGGALTFDGVDDSAISISQTLVLSEAFTASAWMKFDKYAYIQNITTGPFNFKWRAAGNYPYWNMYNSAGTYLGATTYTKIPDLNEWHYYTFTYDGVNRSVYLDGAFDNQVATTGLVLMPNSLNITSDGGERMSGGISNVTIYNRSLSAAEIQKNYKSLRSRYPIAKRGVNVSPGFSGWTLSGGATYNSTSGELILGSAGLATSPLIRVDSPTSMHMGADYYATVSSANAGITPNGGSHMSTYYYAADGVTAAYNSANYTANGCAQGFALNVWYLSDQRCLFWGGPNVVYAKIIYRGSSGGYASSDLKIKAPLLVLTD